MHPTWLTVLSVKFGGSRFKRQEIESSWRQSAEEPFGKMLVRWIVPCCPGVFKAFIIKILTYKTTCAWGSVCQDHYQWHYFYLTKASDVTIIKYVNPWLVLRPDSMRWCRNTSHGFGNISAQVRRKWMATTSEAVQYAGNYCSSKLTLSLQSYGSGLSSPSDPFPHDQKCWMPTCKCNIPQCGVKHQGY